MSAATDPAAHNVYDFFAGLERVREPKPDPNCGRCGGPAGPEGAWCDQCITECKEYTRWLDAQTAGGAQ